MAEFFISEAKKKARQERFRRELRRVRDTHTRDELAGQTPKQMSKRKLESADIETLALWYLAAQVEMDYYSNWAQARTASNRLDRIQDQIKERLGEECLI